MLSAATAPDFDRILAPVPGVLGVWSPGLDRHGNSLAGSMALERFTDLTGQSVF